MLRKTSLLLIFGIMLFSVSQQAQAILPNIFATQPAGNVPASFLDTNFTFLESQGVQGVVSTGSANSYIVTPPDAWLGGYINYIARTLTVMPSVSNTGASTINVSGLGNVSIYKNVGGIETTLAANDLKQNIPAILICDGSGFLLANPSSVSSSTANTYFNIPSNPTGTSSLSFVMMGLAGALTPATTGTVRFEICGNITNSSSGDGAQITLHYGTGTAPVNGAPPSGSASGYAPVYIPSNNSFPTPFCLPYIATGLTVGTAYWFDAEISAVSSGTASIANIGMSAQEIK